MGMSRRGFLKSLVIAGGSLLFQGHGGLERRDADSAATSDRGSQGAPGEWEPAYIRLERTGELADRIEQAQERLKHCDLCPRMCGVNRPAGQQGACRNADKAVVYTAQPHFGEELPLVGARGSGTIFFSNCNLRCVFCQNWPIAHEGRGPQVSDDQIAEVMLALQRTGCHNINLVTPTHIMPHILNATRIAMKKGLRLPLCYNTGGYERVDMIRLLDGIVDIYLPDLKFMDGDQAAIYLGSATDYPQMAQAAILEMHRQVGELKTDRSGVALRGLMIRHLVMPNRVAGTRAFIQWVKQNLPASTYLNIMSQYRVEHRAFEYPAIARAITPGEFVEAMTWAEEAGMTNLDKRSLSLFEVHRRRG